VEASSVALPKGHERGGDEWQPGDEVVGAWSRQQHEKMDQAFAERMARALRQRSARRRDDGSG
jgi:hypothetical protein